MKAGTYSKSFKTQMVTRLVGPRAMSAAALAKEVGISHGTLSRWLVEASRVPVDMNKNREETSTNPAPERTGRRAQDWTSEDKLRVILESLRLSDAGLGEFLRREGLHEAQLREWREAALEALEPPSVSGKKRKNEAKRVRELEKELRRKEKALAETAALLVLEKKLQVLWGSEDNDTDEESAR